MTNYTHTLTPIERACGVTLEDVARELPRGLFVEGEKTFIVSSSTPPALAGSVARCAFAGQPFEFTGMNKLGQLVYRLTASERTGFETGTL